MGVETICAGLKELRRTHRPGSVQAWPNALSHADQRRLDQLVYVVVPDVGNLATAEALVRSVGDLIPQYNGHLTHDVTYRPGNDHRSYSQSANTILANTEAPGWHPSPAYLALAPNGSTHVWTTTQQRRPRPNADSEDFQ